MVFYRDVTDEQFQQLVSQLKPWGVPVLVYHRRDNMRHLETRGQKGFYMGPGSGPSMDRVFLGTGGSRAVQTCSRTTSIRTTACHAHAPAP